MEALRAMGRDAGLPLNIQGMPVAFSASLGGPEVAHDFREHARRDRAAYGRLATGLADAGVWVAAPRHLVPVRRARRAERWTRRSSARRPWCRGQPRERAGAMSRIGVGGFFHETNTFNPLPTTSREFREPPGMTWAGPELDEAFDGAQPVLTGFARGLRAEGQTIVPLLFTMAGTWTGRIAEEALEWAAGELEERVRREAPDALLLHLHGAAASDPFDDPEADDSRRLRAVMGERPIVTVNDAHGNVGPAWLERADVAVAYKMIPPPRHGRARRGGGAHRRTDAARRDRPPPPSVDPASC